jgi:hypothetical protein
MNPTENISGLRCHFLTVVSLTDELKGGHRLWLCLCDCGKPTKKTAWFLKNGRVKSCGCRTKSLISKSRTRHGETDTPTWKSWKSMLDRCDLKAHKSYADYGGRGITICDAWRTYENFRSDMGERPYGMTLGRVDNSGNYEPSNCHWETYRQQARNRRSSRIIAHDGIVATLSEWSERTGLTGGTIWKRLNSGWPVDQSLMLKAKKQHNSRCSWVCE